MLDKLLTEQANPASEGIDALGTEQILRVINAEDRRCRGGHHAGNPQHCQSCRRYRRSPASAAAGCSISAPAPAAGWASSTPPNARRPSTSRRNWSRGSSRAGSSALARPSEASEDDPAERANAT